MTEAPSVKAYFDEQADRYHRKYSEQSPYLNFMFRERIRMAAGSINLSGKKVLDIGAGTGALYDYLVRHNISGDYFACDISSSMLKHSHIPVDRQFTGQAQHIEWSVDRFDCIFMLGVTNYTLLPIGWPTAESQ